MRSARLQVETFPSACEFLEREACEEPCCLVLDVRMPGLNGLELQAVLTKKRRMIPIVFISAHGDIPLNVKAMNEGAVDFLPKPFDDRDLLKAIHRAIKKDTSCKAGASRMS